MSMKNRQRNGQKKNHKRTNKNLQNTTQKTKDRATQTQLKIGGGGTTSDTRLVLVTNMVWKGSGSACNI